MNDGADDRPGRADAFAESAGAYVLGALDATERAAFEAHLSGCPACRAAVDDVAHLPALLAAVPPGGLADPPPTVLTGLLSGLLAEVTRDELARRRSQRRRRAWTAAGLVGAAAAGFLAGALVRPPVGGGDAGAGPVTTVALESAADVPIVATVDLEPVAWGTRLVVTCVYEVGGRGPYDAPAPTGVEYALVVRDADGNAQHVASWFAAPGQDATVPAATSLDLDEIAELEMTSDGVVVLSGEV